MNLSLERLIFNPADPNNSPNLGAYLRAGSDGDQISSTNVGGKEGLDVNIINASIVVTATDLDIRNLSATQDNVAISDGTDTLAVNADGSINVAITSAPGEGVYLEDSVAADGDFGQSILCVRSDLQGTLVSASGDYAWFQQDSMGRMKTSDVPDLASKVAVVVAGLAEVSLSGTPLAGRTKMLIQNQSDKSVFIGPTGVLTTTGIEITKGGSLSLELGEHNELFVITSAAAKNVRVMELA